MNMAGMAMKRDQGPDLNDVTYDAFLANDRTLADPQTIKVEQGGQLLLRVINGSAMSNFHLYIGALDGELIAADGFEVKPIAGKTFPIAVAQRLDIRIRLPAGAGAYPIFALLEGTSRRTGIVLDAGGTITKMSDKAEKIEPAITLDLERQLEAVKPLRRREADRTHRLDLTGDMAKYVWSINNVVWTKDMPPLPVAEGERVELVLTNKTMMSHPMHLHGHEFQVVEIDGMRIAGAVRDTILVRPMGQVVVAFNANNPGWWAFHCHLLYHLDAGMFTTIRYVWSNQVSCAGVPPTLGRRTRGPQKKHVEWLISNATSIGAVFDARRARPLVL
jgi:FtsP/CotA-like multicopper oxidase with cupredoxin domain